MFYFLNLDFSQPADIAVLVAAGLAVVLLLVVFITTMVSHSVKKKKAKAMSNNNVKQDEVVNESTEQEPVVAEEPVVKEEQALDDEPSEEVAEETPVIDEEPVVSEEPVVEEEPVEEVAVPTPIKEEPKEEVVAEPVKEEPKPKKAAKPKEEVVAEPVKEEPKPKKAAKPKEEVVAKPVKEEPKPKKTAKPKEEPVVEEEPQTKGRSYNGKYEYYSNGDGYQYRLKASNGEILIVSETYASKDNVLKAIDAVKRNVTDGTIKIAEDKHGMYNFKLVSKNYRVIAVSSNYSSEKSAVRASESFKNFALKANIVEIETPVDKESLSATPVDLGVVEDKNGGKYVLEKEDGVFNWSLRANNGQILLQVSGYTSKNSALNSIEVFKKNAANGVFKVAKDKNDHYHFRLYSQSGRVAAIGETYTSKQSAESAAISVASYYKNSELVEEK